MSSRALSTLAVDEGHINTHNSSSSSTLESELENNTQNEKYIVHFEPGTGEDPREWSRARKWYATFCAAFLCLCVALGSAIVTGDLETPVKEFNTSQEIVNLTVTMFVIGFGIGPMILSPLSEIFGRTPIYQISIFIFFIFTLPGALAKNVTTLVVSRTIAGLAASAPMCNVGGTVSDVWATHERGIPMAFFSASIFMGPCLGPLIGGFIGEYAGWRWIYWVLFILLGFAFTLTLFMHETLATRILHVKARRLRKEFGDTNYRTPAELKKEPFSEVMLVTLSRPVKLLLTEPVIFFMTIYLSFIYSILYLLFFAFPIAFVEVRGFSAGETGLTFLSVMFGIALAMFCMPLQERWYRVATQDGAFPEARLYFMMIGAIIQPISLFLFAFTGGFNWVHWIAPCVSGVLFGFALILIYIGANSYIIDSYAHCAASAVAAKTLMRSIIGAMVPLYVVQMFHGMGFQWAGLLLAMVAVGLLPIPFVFYKYGEKIRARSTMAEKAVRGTQAVGTEKK
ncbi:major facilitator superfamily domain-containing protein [Flagelloscypha sp. PMI_526]|nr:major facilitator superfamily domain-containing protein [Flagelloscypha sp. PMI_526]